MNTVAITSFDAVARKDERGEYWSARDLRALLGYAAWQHFETAIERAIAASVTARLEAWCHIAPTTKRVEIGSGAVRMINDYWLTRLGAYLVAMNGDPRKPEVAAAQTYFATKARQAEVYEARLGVAS